MSKCILFLFLFLVSVVEAQEFKKTTESEIRGLAKDHLELFQYYLSELTNDKHCSYERKAIRTKCLKLFSSDAEIETMALNKHKDRFHVSNYLLRVSEPPVDVDIDISFAQDPVITKVEEISYNKYEVFGNLIQIFEKTKNNSTYSDITVKSAIVVIEDLIIEGQSKRIIKITRINAEKIFRT